MNRLRYLDGLRGIAALIVVLHHFMLAFYPATYTGREVHSHFSGFQYDVFFAYSPLNILLSGNLAVCIFFVLSGIVLSRHFLMTLDPAVLSEQAARRYFRLGIPIFASVCIGFILLQSDLLFHKQAAGITKSDFWLGQIWPHKFTVLNFLLNGLIDVLMTGQNDLNNVLWTMRIEFFGSFLVFATLALTQYLRHRFLIYLLIIVCQFWLGNYYYVCFIAGVVMVNAQVCEMKWFISWRPLVAWAIFAMALFLGSFPSIPALSPEGFYGHMSLPIVRCANFYHAISAILLVAAIQHLAVAKKLLESKPLLFLGRISFSMYLIHSLILGSVVLFTFLHIYPLLGYEMSVWVLLLPFIVLTFIGSYYFTLYIDERGTSLSKTIYLRYFKK